MQTVFPLRDRLADSSPAHEFPQWCTAGLVNVQDYFRSDITHALHQILLQWAVVAMNDKAEAWNAIGQCWMTGEVAVELSRHYSETSLQKKSVEVAIKMGMALAAPGQEF